jgi:hypothetical protein
VPKRPVFTVTKLGSPRRVVEIDLTDTADLLAVGAVHVASGASEILQLGLCDVHDVLLPRCGCL